VIEKLCALAAIAATSAFAQSTVTISGFGNLSYDLFSVSQGKAASARTSNKSEDRVTDNSGRIIFASNEDLGGGMRAFWQVDVRPLMDGTARVTCSLCHTCCACFYSRWSSCYDRCNCRS
jgi:predicted porin